MFEIKTKNFSELTTNELYAIFQLRSEVFVVEQDCVYQDIDYKDEKSFHVIGYKNERIVAYSRIFKPGDYFEMASIGRVVVAKNQRQFGYGHDIMNASINSIEKLFKVSEIKISAQCYLKNFYKSHNFTQIGEEYLEDGIPHIAMVKTK